MQFNVAQLLKEPTGSTRSYAVDESFEPLEGTGSDHARGSVRMLRTDSGIWLSSEMDTTIRCTCSRCLAQYPQSLHLSIEEEYFPTVDVVTGVSLALPEDADPGQAIDGRHTLDLLETVRQYILVNMPMKPLCKDNCRGLCPHCDANLTQGACGCIQPIPDQRWAPLLELLTGCKSPS